MGRDQRRTWVVQALTFQQQRLGVVAFERGPSEGMIFEALRDQISTIVKNAVFNNFNLVDGSTNQVQALASADGTRRITAQAQNMKLSGTIVTLKTTSTVSTQAKASAMITMIQTSLTNVNSALAKLSSGAAKFSIQATFTQKLSDTLTAGLGNLVDANMAQESARLQSLKLSWKPRLQNRQVPPASRPLQWFLLPMPLPSRWQLNTNVWL